MHTLSLLHEHQRSNRTHNFDEEKLKKAYSHLSKESLDHNFIKEDLISRIDILPQDNASITQYGIQASWTIPKAGQTTLISDIPHPKEPHPKELSDKAKHTIGYVYPMPTGGHVKQNICPVILTTSEVSLSNTETSAVRVPQIGFQAPQVSPQSSLLETDL